MSYEYERVVTPSSGLRLHLNENTAGCSPRVIEALRQLTREDAASYPDYEATVDACARRLNVSPDQLLLTNGLDEGILTCSVTALRSSGGTAPEAIVVVPAFDMYAACADAAGGRVIEIRCGADFEFPLDSVRRQIRPQTRIIYVTTPNNPTGRPIPRDVLVRVAEAAPQAIVFVDEAYVDFGGQTLIDGRDFPGAFPNIIVGRTFAKAYGLAGLRAGALIGDAAALAPVRRVVPPYSLNVFAAAALRAAIADTDYYSWYLDQVKTSKDMLYDVLQHHRIRHWKSDANFVLADFGTSATRVVAALAARQVFVRDRSRDASSPGCVRITAGVVEHTQVCVTALEEVLCDAER
jgi:histidinol-phosphate aminotransferase